jgi:hypothetical protein
MKKLIILSITLLTLSACSQLGLSSAEPAEPVDLSGIESQLDALDKKIEEQNKKLDVRLDVIEAKLDKPVAKPKPDAKPKPENESKLDKSAVGPYGLSESNPLKDEPLTISITNAIVNGIGEVVQGNPITSKIYVSDLTDVNSAVIFQGDADVVHIQTPIGYNLPGNNPEPFIMPTDKFDWELPIVIKPFTLENEGFTLKFSHKIESKNPNVFFLYGFLYGVTIDFEYEIVEVSK